MSKARDLADSAQEINILDGKSFLDEDNLASDSATGIASQQSIKAYVDGITTTNITSTGALNSGSITSGFGNINNGSSTITTTGAITGGSFVIGSADINENDLESIDGITAGTVSASKAVVVNTDKDVTGFRNLTATGTITGSLSGTLSGSLSSTTTATTQAESDDSTKIATTAYVTDKITTLIGGAPSTLNDLNELAAAINDDANYNSTLTTALGTKLAKAGGTMTGDIAYLDNVKAKFGAGDDLQIFHDGSNSFINEGGAGDLTIKASNNLYLMSGSSEVYAKFTTDGAATLYHNNSAKIATTSTGIDVTGNTVTDKVQTENLYRTGVNGSGIHFSTNATLPTNETSAVSNGTEDLGSNAYRWKDLHLSGTVNAVEADIDISTNARLTINDGIGEVGIGNVALQAQNSAGSALKPLGFRAEDIRFATGSSERMRIDSSGNLLVGKTASNIATVGAELKSTGELVSTVNNDACAFLNRKSSDGAIINFRKDGSTIGNVGVVNDDHVYIGSNDGDDAYIKFSSNLIKPVANGGADRDNAISLGTSSVRFKEGRFVTLYGDGSNLTGVGGSTTRGDVGTYTVGATSNSNTTAISAGATAAGNTLVTDYYSSTHQRPLATDFSGSTSCGLSGTWRNMGGTAVGSQFNVKSPTLWVRIS
jgi:hypothetical protein